VWTTPTDFLVLQHEEFAVWSACVIPEGYVTLGADKTIRVWSAIGTVVQRIEKAHADVPRASRYLPGRNLLVTASNDGTIKEWSVDGLKLSATRTVTVSDRYLYSLSLIDEDTYVVSSEDRCAYVVSSPYQAVVDVLPMTGSVWGVDVLSNGDVITVCADGFARVFTQDRDRRATLDVVSTYFTDMESLTFNDPALETVNILDLPDISGLTADMQVPGRANLIRDGKEKIVVIWSPGYQRWIKLGRVTKTKGAQREKVYDPEGRCWDFCMTVNLEDGRNLPLYVNFDTNQFAAAAEFIQKHNLQMHWFDQIANFIERERRPYRVEMDDKPRTAPRSEAFPMNNPNFLREVLVDRALAKLRTLNDTPELVLTDAQFALLAQPTSPAWFQLVLNVALTWPIWKSWPLIDVLRGRILEPTARSSIPPDGLVQIVKRIVDASIPDDFAILNLGRLLSNMLLNYAEVVVSHIDIENIFAGLADRFAMFTVRTQVSIANALLNYSTTLTNREKAADALMGILLKAFGTAADEDTVYRLVYAIGNAAVASGLALEKLRLRPDLIDQKLQAATQITHPVLKQLCLLLS
jgi:hypothetical protein